MHVQSPSPVIELDQLYLGWRDRLAVRDVSGAFEKGSMTAVVGPNGAGKSTLIKGIMGQVSPVRGRIRLNVDARRHIACMPQADTLDRRFPVTVYDLVALGAWSRVGAWRGFCRDEHARVMAALQQVGLADFASRIIGTLSGGQLQRALFARLLLHDAQLAFFENRLRELEAEILANAGATTENLRETQYVPDPADRATIEEEHALELRTRDRERKLLKKVQQSLQLIESGEYGWCEETGEPIGIARLLARPTANLSLEAQERREKRQKLYGD